MSPVHLAESPSHLAKTSPREVNRDRSGRSVSVEVRVLVLMYKNVTRSRD